MAFFCSESPAVEVDRLNVPFVREFTNRGSVCTALPPTPIDTTTHLGVCNGTYDRHREVVQRREGLWLHHARRWTEGLLRPSFGHSGLGFPHPRSEEPT